MEATKKTVTIQLTEEQHKMAKIVAAHAGKTLKEIFLEAIERLNEKQKAEGRQ